MICNFAKNRLKEQISHEFSMRKKAQEEELYWIRRICPNCGNTNVVADQTGHTHQDRLRDHESGKLICKNCGSTGYAF